jgi:hypothetical protein
MGIKIFRVLLFTLFLNQLFFHSLAQDSLQFQGTWKVVGLNNGVNSDYKLESYTVNTPFGNSLRGRTDSSRVIADFLNWASSCSNCFYVFGPGNLYKEFREDELRSDGTFRLKAGKQEMDVSFIKDKTPRIVTYLFAFEKEQLILFVLSFFIKDKLALRLEKQ